MNLRLSAAVFFARAARWAIHLLRRSGTAFPGRIALKLCPDLLAPLSRGVHIVLVTGTNGKTTSSRMLEQAFLNAGKKCLANRSGANLIAGIATDFACGSTLGGRCKYDYAVIECDEAASRTVLKYLKPDVILVTNVFRDQLDRFGAVSQTLAAIREGISHTPGSVLCLNGDCSMSVSLAELPNPVVFYGLNVPVYHAVPDEVSDARRCPHCGEAYEYGWHTYAHLGGFRCPKCGYHRPEPQVAVSRICSMDIDSSTVELSFGGETLPLRICLPAAYNIYNACGAAAALLQMGFSGQEIVGALADFSVAFGRMERFRLGALTARMILVKNPAGCNQTMNFLSTLTESSLFAVCLNDHAGDGTDVSWIWDADFEKLAGLGDRLTGVLIGGDRAEEMLLRLKYAGIAEEKLRLFRDYDSMIAAMTAQDRPVFIMPTYSAMIELRAKLRKLCGGGEIWQ